MKGTLLKVTKKYLMVAALASGLSLSACAPAGGSADAAANGGSSSVNVGIVYSKTGPLAAYGEAYANGLEAGLDYATNGTGAVDGHKLNISYKDDGGDPDKAVSQAKDLIGQGYKILAGTESSGVAGKLAEQAAQNKVLYISGPAAADSLTSANKYTFRSGRQTYQDVATAATVLNDISGKKVVVFAQDNAFGKGNLAAVKAVLGAKGAQVSDDLVAESATEFTPFAQKLKDAKPDLVFVAWAGATSGAMWQALDQQGVLGAIPVVTGLGDASTFSAYGPAAEKIHFLNHYFPGAGGNDVEKAMTTRLEKAGHKADLFSPDGFVAAQMIVQAVKEGKNDPNAMVKALEGWKFQGPKGETTVRASDHAMIQNMYVAKLVNKSGTWTPELVKTVPAADVAPPEKPIAQ